METIPTLIVGASGTGKELTARAIGLSRHIDFDERKRQFTQSLDGAFHPVNIAALSPTIIESELFGHTKGAFTGATNSRQGWFETCQRGHSVFLDEIGELSPELQVKLLRVVQNREFYRLGDSGLRRFSGKLIVATNRDFSCELAEGRFREDLYYRLCSDVITTPTLVQQIADNTSTLQSLVERIVLRQLGEKDAARSVVGDVMEVIQGRLGQGYSWPGNFRELEQCAWNVLIRKDYRPLRQQSKSEESPVIAAVREGTASADDVVSLYCKSIYAKTGSYAATARIVSLDQRTVKRRVDQGE